MIKVVTTILIAIALCGSAPRANAQSAAELASQAASEEAAKRQANTIQLRRTLAEAAAARQKNDLVEAARQFEDAYTLVQRIGLGVDQESAETLAGLTEARMELARRAERRGDLAEADKQVTRVLTVDPRNLEAQQFKTALDKKISEQAGRVPSREQLARVDEIRAERVKTSTLVQDARLLMETGKLDEAEERLRQAVKEDPEHRAAFYYLNLIKERRYAQEARKREIAAKDMLVEVEQKWHNPIQRELLPEANPYARTNRIYTSPGRQAISTKLDRIILDEWLVPSDIPLIEVIKELSAEARKRDPDRRGINFIISSQLDKPGPALFNPAAGGFPGAVDPLTGQPLGQQPQSDQPVVIEDFTVKMDPPLRNVRLADVLDAIVRVAKPGSGQNQNIALKYSIEEYAVVFSQRQIEPDQLYSRTFRVDPNTFKQGLEGMSYTFNPFQGFVTAQGGAGGAGGGGGGGGVGGGGQNGQNGQGGGPGGLFSFGGGINGQQGGGGGAGGAGGQTGGGITSVTITNLMFNIQDEVRNFFIAAGVDFATNNTATTAGAGFTGQPTPPQKALFFNDRTGVLFVRATLRDLDIIEGAIQALNVTPPQVTIEAKFAEIGQNDSKAVGFDWFLGNTLMRNGDIGVQGGTAPSYRDSSSFANPSGVFPGTFGVPSQPTRLTSDQLLTTGLRQSAPEVATLTGILTDPQFRVVIRALEQRGGVDLLSAPRVTTVSGRQARIAVEDTQTIIVGLSVQGLGGGGGAVAAGGVTGVGN
ncbi:MAG: hypothetical protein SFY81_08120 [Verrucomicrobiota bacterium]|nr:hypothetical protein [Verrucomicrobiota bacterium]